MIKYLNIKNERNYMKIFFERTILVIKYFGVEKEKD